MTRAVDWALKTYYLSIYFPSCVKKSMSKSIYITRTHSIMSIHMLMVLFFGGGLFGGRGGGNLSVCSVLVCDSMTTGWTGLAWWVRRSAGTEAEGRGFDSPPLPPPPLPPSFGSPFSSRIVIYGHCLVTLPCTVNEMVKKWFTSLAHRNAEIIPVVTAATVALWIRRTP